MKTIYLSILILLFSFFSCKDASELTDASEKVTQATKTEEKSAQGSSIQTEKISSDLVVITTKHGSIKIRLLKDLAPKHVESFLSLVQKGFFDGTTFHRVIPGFMIQGGDPNSKDPSKRHLHGMGGPGYTVPAEFSKLSHKRGIVSAARASDPNSAGSQFFICVKDSNFLDGQYSIFGEVIEGMEVADKIVNEPRDERDNPLDRVEMKIKISN